MSTWFPFLVSTPRKTLTNREKQIYLSISASCVLLCFTYIYFVSKSNSKKKKEDLNIKKSNITRQPHNQHNRYASAPSIIISNSTKQEDKQRATKNVNIIIEEEGKDIYPRSESNDTSAILFVEEDKDENGVEESDEEKEFKKQWHLAVECWSKSDYSSTITHYTNAIKLCPIQSHNDLKVLFNNRAACYERLSMWANVIHDCSDGLKIDSLYVRLLKRRSKAYEKMYDYENAIFDATLAYTISEVRDEKPMHMRLEALIHEYATELAAKKSNEDFANRNNGIVLPLTTISTSMLLNSTPNREDFKLPKKYFINFYFESYINNVAVFNSRSLAENRLLELEKLIKSEKGGKEGLLYLEKGIICKYLQRYSLAQINFKKAIQYIKEKKNGGEALAEAYYNFAIFLSLSGNYREAMEYFEMASDLTQSVYTYIELAKIAFQLNEKDKCMEYFALAQLIDKENADLFCQRGQIYLLNGQFEEAIKDFDHAILLRGDFACAHMYLGVVYFHLNEKEKSIKSFEIAIHLSPAIPQFYAYFGEALIAFEEIEKGVNTLEEGINCDSTCPLSYLFLAQYISSLENSNTSYNNEMLNNVIDTDDIPDLLQIVENKNLVEINNLSFNNTNSVYSNQSLCLYAKAISIDDDCEMVYERLAQFYYLHQNVDLCLQYYDKAICKTRSIKKMTDIFDEKIACDFKTRSLEYIQLHTLSPTKK